jgi:hypothetical protein
LAASATNGCKKGALLAQRMAETLTVRLHPLACDRAEEVAFGRWLRNEAVTVEELHEHCGREIADLVAGRHVLAIQDTTELNYQRHAGRTRGLGTVGNGTDLGLFLHPTLAIDAESHHCLGLIGAQVYVRHEGATVNRRQRSIEEKESYRWLQGVETADQVLKEAAHVTRVQDREGDIYEQFARPRAAHSDLLIRISQDRKLISDELLFTARSAMPVVHRFRLTLKAQPGKRKARTAKLELRFGEVTIAHPAYLSARVTPPQVTLRVVDVCEYDTPPGEKPIHWRLGTTHEVKDGAASPRKRGEVRRCVNLIGTRSSRLWSENFQAARIFGRLGQQPILELCDLWQARSHLRADDPVGVGHFQRNIDRSDETTVDDIPSGKRSASKRNALAVDGGIDHHARAVQNWTVSDRIADAGGFKPSRPGLPVVDTQQRKFQQVRRCGYAVTHRGPRQDIRDQPR